MSYIQGTDYISITDEVRELARSVVNADFTNDEIIRYQFMRFSQIRTMTQKDAWSTLEREYGSLQLIETKLAASDLIEHYGTAQDVAIWQAMRDSALSDLKETMDYMTSSTDSAASSILETDYKSWNLNRNIQPPNRLRRIGGSGVAETVAAFEVGAFESSAYEV